MDFWNYIGLSSKKDNDQLHKEIKLLKQTIETQSKSQKQTVDTSISEILKAMSQQNEQFSEVLNKQIETIDNNTSCISQQILNLEKSMNQILDTQTKELAEALKIQNKKIQKLDSIIQQVEKMNAEILKSMQAVWLVQLSQQVENEVIKK